MYAQGAEFLAEDLETKAIVAEIQTGNEPAPLMANRGNNEHQKDQFQN